MGYYGLKRLRTCVSKQNGRLSYIGIAKSKFAEFMNAICFNLRKLTVIKPHSLSTIME